METSHNRRSAVLKIMLTVVGVLIVGGLWLIWPILCDVSHSTKQSRALQNRSDYQQIAAACVALSRAVTNEDMLIYIADPRVPALLRSLSPRYITVTTNDIRLEFHGGFDHYGYRVEQSETDPKEWSISFYTEQGHKPLAKITHD